MIHPHTQLQYIDDHKGYGVFATQFLPKGTITYVKDSLEMEISPDAYRNHNPEMQTAIEKYSYTDERGYRIVSWDFAKYVNHCCNCNTMSTGYGFEMAIRDIQPGEEITDEYALFNLTQSMDLQCAHDCCRGQLRPEDFDLYYKNWDLKLREALPLIWQVKQPLAALLDAGLKDDVDAFLNNPEAYRSVYQLKARALKAYAPNGKGRHLHLT
ncbi:MAG: SET domain-containing protein [Phaeodactylibacter sp.]|uniref:SET domain-containing protein n=1 Tax=Phaeodactylibacter sp. TaxID=1940289 RepID=UPI0032EACEFB